MRRKKYRVRRTKKVNINHKNFLYFFLIIMVVGAVGFGVHRFFNSSYFRINTVLVNVPIEGEVLGLIGDKTMFDIDMGALYDDIMRRHPEFKSLVIKKVFPSTLQIIVRRRTPVAQIKKDGFYPVDREGVVLAHLTEPARGVIIIDAGVYYGALYRGKIVKDDGILVAISLAEALKRSSIYHRFSIKEISSPSPRSVSFTMNGVNVIIGEEDFDRKLKLLDKFLNRRFKYDISTLRYIDLRYCGEEGNIYLGYRR